MESSYGLWWMVGLSSFILIVFVFSFAKPQSRRDWKSFGAFSGFMVALFTEMYGFPLTIYLFSGWLAKRFPAIDWYSHNAGHLWESLLGLRGDPHFSALHAVSGFIIFGGFILIANSWKILHAAQREHRVAKTGPYARIRHPQYAGFIAIMIGFLLEWPTLLTLIMFPILVYMYVRLAKSEERESLKEFGKEYNDYMENTPSFIPKFNSSTSKVENNNQN